MYPNLKSTPLGVVATFAGCLVVFLYVYNIRKHRRLLQARQSQTDAADRQAEALRVFFLQQIKKSEEQLAANKIDLGLESLANAIVMCSRPVLLLKQMKLGMPANRFDLLIVKLLEMGYAQPAIDELAGGDHIQLNNGADRSPSIAGIRFN